MTPAAAMTDDAPARLLDEPAIAPASQPVARPRSTRYQSLDIWRGAACLMLVVYHGMFYADHTWQSRDPSTWTLGGLVINLIGRLWIGVPVFFVVSGYCIAASCDASRKKTHSLRTYFSRRFRRIYPPLWIACALCVAFVLAVTTSETIRQGAKQLPVLAKFTPGYWFGNLTATESWLPRVVGGETTYLMKNTWTLCYEEQFYFVVGIMLLFSARRFYVAAAVVTAATLLARHATRAAGTSLEGFFCDGHWLLFAMGILVYFRLQYAPVRSRWPVVAALVATAAYAVIDNRRGGASPYDKHVDEYIAAAALFGLLLIWLHPRDAKLAGSRWLAPLAAYGRMSYSVYLTHFPVVVVMSFLMAKYVSSDDGFTALVTVPLGVALSIPVGRAFYLLVERRFMNAPLEPPRAAAAA